MEIIGHEVRTSGSGLQSSSHRAVNSPAGSMGPGCSALDYGRSSVDLTYRSVGTTGKDSQENPQ